MDGTRDTGGESYAEHDPQDATAATDGQGGPIVADTEAGEPVGDPAENGGEPTIAA